MAASITTIRGVKPRAPSLGWLLSRTLNPETLHLAAPDLRGLETQVANTIDRIRPDFVWAEESFGAAARSPSPITLVPASGTEASSRRMAS